MEDQCGNVDSETAQVTVESFEPDFTNKYGLANGDTVHISDCLPWDISQIGLEHYTTLKDHAKLTSHKYRQELPENAIWSMYELGR